MLIKGVSIFLFFILSTSASADYLEVTAYNAVPSQTDSTPNIAAWGDYIPNVLNGVAISQNLVQKYSRGTCIKISGIPGKWVVLDKMGKTAQKGKITLNKNLDVLVQEKYPNLQWNLSAKKIGRKKRGVEIVPGDCKIRIAIDDGNAILLQSAKKKVKKT